MLFNEVLHKICHYCAYRGRSHKEVNNKLLTYNLSSNQHKKILQHLVEENYFDDYQFARDFARGKFRIKKWGKVKIRHHLKWHELDIACIEQALNEISEENYYMVLKEIIEKKNREIMQQGKINRYDKVACYAIRKGYESDLVWQVITALSHM